MSTVTISGTIAHAYKLQSPISVLSITSTGYVEGGAKYGVYSSPTSTAAYTVQNDGRIKGGVYGVFLGGGSLTNGSASDTTASIAGGVDGVRCYATGTIGLSFSNFGTIASTGTTSSTDAGVYIDLNPLGPRRPAIVNGSLSDTTARIEGLNGIEVGGAGNYDTIKNFATITTVGTQFGAYGAVVGVGVLFDGTGEVLNGAAGDTAAYIYGLFLGVEIQATHGSAPSPSVINYGTIKSAAIGVGVGVLGSVGHYGTVINGPTTGSHALIEGTDGVVLEGPFAYAKNFGTVIGTTQYGVRALRQSSVENGGPEDSAALIEGARGVFITGSLANYGTIIGQNTSSATASYAGVTGGGVIINGSGAGSRALIEGVDFGVLIAGTVRNFGTIEATASGGYALKLNGNSALQVEAGSKLIGKVSGGGGALDLASGAGVIAGISGGTIVAGDVDYQDFGTLEVGSGAAFTTTGVGTIASGGVANLHVAGTLDLVGTIIVTDSLFAGGVIDGVGHLDLEGGISNFATGAQLTTAHVLVSGASTLVEMNSLTYAGAWNQTAGTTSVAKGDTLKLTGAADALSGTLAGAGIIVLSGGGDTLKALTVSNKTEIMAASASLSGVLDVIGTLTVSCPGLTVSGATQFTGGGTVQLSNLTTNKVIGSSAVSLLENSDKIEGAGRLGAGQLRLTNDAGGTILANGTAALIVDTGVYKISNAGLIEASGAGGLVIAGAVANTGTLATHGGNLTVEGAVTGAGSVSIFGAEASFTGAFSENVAFVIKGELALAQSQTYAGTISGYSKTGDTSLDLEDISFTGATASYSGTVTSGVLTVIDGAHTAKIHLAGNYTASTWSLSSDGHGGVLVIDPTAASPSVHAMAQAIAGFGSPPTAHASPPDVAMAPTRSMLALPHEA